MRSDFRGEIEIWIGDAALRQVSEARLTGVAGVATTSRYVFTLDVSANEVQCSVGDFVFVMGWFTTLDRYRR